MICELGPLRGDLAACLVCLSEASLAPPAVSQLARQRLPCNRRTLQFRRTGFAWKLAVAAQSGDVPRAFGRPSRKTAVAFSGFARAALAQVRFASETGGSFSKLPSAPWGRQRQCAAFGCGRSAGTLPRSVITAREGPLSLSLTCKVSRRRRRGSGSKVDLALAQKTAAGNEGSI